MHTLKPDYAPQDLEKHWQKIWKEQKTYQTEGPDSSKPKFYVLDMFPYPSGAGLHVGHPLGYIASDIYARYKRLQGYNVLHPMGFDAFGLPAEQYAIQTGRHPADTTRDNVARYKEQLDQIGLSYDWSREVNTSEADYYKWTQWIFIRLFHHGYDNAAQKARPISELEAHLEQHGSAGLSWACDDETPAITAEAFRALSGEAREAYLQQFRLAFTSEAYVNWCPALGTVLANDEVKDGFSERGGYPVERKLMRQFMLRITAYADRLLEGLDTIDWSESIKEQQRNWIGRSTGAMVDFHVHIPGASNASPSSPQKGEKRGLGGEEGASTTPITVFTTRPDTLYGVTFMVLAPEHPLVPMLTTDAQRAEVEAYVEATARRSELDRKADVKRVSGAFTGSYAAHPLSGNPVAVWIADYVLAGYGTGAVMAVPSSDTRDYAFASHFGLEIIPVQEGPQTDITAADFDPKAGTLINSPEWNGQTVPQAIESAIAILEARGLGKRRTQYRIRDAVFGRQRYWGEPIPVYYENGIPKTLPDEVLPLRLPEVDKFLPTAEGEPPLARAKDWHYMGHPLETTTMPGWAGSSWYFLRYMDPKNENGLASQEALDYWGQVDLYLGGSEHATGHLLYARFWNKFLKDLGLVKNEEPFKKLVNQGMIQGVSAFVKKCPQPFDNQIKLKYNSSSLDRSIGTPITIDVSTPTRICFTEKGYHTIELIEPIYDLGDNFSRIHIPIEYLEEGINVLGPKGQIAYDKFSGDKNLYITNNGFWIDGHYTSFKDYENNIHSQEAGEEFYVKREVEKMSKSKYNVVNPDDIVSKYGADTLRLYEMFLGPLEQSKPWNTSGIEGVAKFLRRFYRLFVAEKGQYMVTDAEATDAELRVLHKTLQKVADDIEKLSFNTIVSTFMIACNELTDLKCHKRSILEPLVIALAPMAPHIAEELWHGLGHEISVHLQPYPEVIAQYLVADTVQYPVSFNGKTRVKLDLPADFTNQQVEEAVLADADVQKYLAGASPKKVIVVPKRMVNLVV